MDTRRRVLVVDHSKVVRSTLAKHLRDDFAVVEESDGEAAWQTLVLNSSIIAVVAGVHLPRLSGHELLARLRVNKLRRLCDIPFLLVVSGQESAQEQACARERGVTDFITRGMSRQDILARIRRLVDWELGQGIAEPSPPAASAPAQPPATSPQDLAGALATALHDLDPLAGTISVIEFGLDEHARLCEEFGAGTMRTITARLMRVLAEKIGPGDTIAASGAASCTIVSPGTSLASSIAFAQRVCRGFGNSQIAVGGVPFTPVISAGIANRPGDAAGSADALLALARQRLQEAQAAGGNRVRADAPSCGHCVDAQYFEALARLWQTGTPSLDALGMQLMPLFKTLEHELSLGLPLGRIEQRLRQRSVGGSPD